MKKVIGVAVGVVVVVAVAYIALFSSGVDKGVEKIKSKLDNSSRVEYGSFDYDKKNREIILTDVSYIVTEDTSINIDRVRVHGIGWSLNGDIDFTNIHINDDEDMAISILNAYQYDLKEFLKLHTDTFKVSQLGKTTAKGVIDLEGENLPFSLYGNGATVEFSLNSLESDDVALKEFAISTRDIDSFVATINQIYQDNREVWEDDYSYYTDDYDDEDYDENYFEDEYDYDYDDGFAAGVDEDYQASTEYPEDFDFDYQEYNYEEYSDEDYSDEDYSDEDYFDDYDYDDDDYDYSDYGSEDYYAEERAEVLEKINSFYDYYKGLQLTGININGFAFHDYDGSFAINNFNVAIDPDKELATVALDNMSIVIDDYTAVAFNVSKFGMNKVNTAHLKDYMIQTFSNMNIFNMTNYFSDLMKYTFVSPIDMEKFVLGDMSLSVGGVKVDFTDFKINTKPFKRNQFFGDYRSSMNITVTPDMENLDSDVAEFFNKVSSGKALNGKLTSESKTKGGELTESASMDIDGLFGFDFKYGFLGVDKLTPENEEDWGAENLEISTVGLSVKDNGLFKSIIDSAEMGEMDPFDAYTFYDFENSDAMAEALNAFVRKPNKIGVKTTVPFGFNDVLEFFSAYSNMSYYYDEEDDSEEKMATLVNDMGIVLTVNDEHEVSIKLAD